MINVRINNRCHPLSITTQHTHGRARANKAKGRVHISICVTYQCVAHRRADARPRANANIPKSVTAPREHRRRPERMKDQQETATALLRAEGKLGPCTQLPEAGS